MTASLEPIWVGDVHDSQTWPPPNLSEVLGWARSEGINANETYRIEVYLLDCPFARVYEYDRDENGTRFCWVEHDHLDDRCDVAKRKPFDVPLTTLPPVTLDS